MTSRARAPAGWLLLLMAAAAAVICAFVWIASAQPWLGLRLAPDLEADAVRITHVAPRSPAGGTGIEAGDTLVSVAPAGAGPAIALTALDLVEEPDVIPSYEGLNLFRDRQGTFHWMLSGGEVRLSVDGPSGPREVTVLPADSRPLASLPYLFWLQVIVAVSGVVVGGWLLAVRPGRHETAFVLVCGWGICLAALSAATYGTRELAIGEDLLRLMSWINATGAAWYGAGVVGLFLVWPRRIAPAWLGWAAIAFVTVWVAAYSLQMLPSPLWGVQIVVMIEVVLMLALGIAQYVVNRRDPLARAALLWATISLTIGSGIFVALISVPVALGRDPVIAQGHAFVAFFLVFVGLAFGVLRFRLFDVSAISSRLLGYAIVIALLAAIDLVLVAVLSVAQDAAFAIALVASLLLYLPLRERIANRLLARRRAFGPEEFQDAAAVALAPDPEARAARWRDLLGARFRPLDIEEAPDAPEAPSIEGGGEFLAVPGRAGLPPLRLHWAEGGRALYAPADARTAESLLSMVETTAGSRDAYLRGALAERERISRDMHDNIGSQLLGALSAEEPARKDDLVRGALGDLREIVWSDADGTAELANLAADMRHEIAELMEGAGIALDWSAEISGAAPIRAVQAARSVLREVAANVVRHSGAGRARIVLAREGDGLRIAVADDGRGMQASPARRGGTRGIEARLAEIGGAARWSPGEGGGTEVEALVPLGSPAPVPLRASA